LCECVLYKLETYRFIRNIFVSYIEYKVYARWV